MASKYINRQESDEVRQMREKILARNKKRKRNILIIIAVAIVIIALILFSIINKTYNSYKILSSVGREDSSNANYIPYKNGYIRYSSGGANYVDSSMTSIWNESFSIANPEANVRGDYISVADIGSNKIVILGDNGIAGKITTDYNIMKTDLTASGAVATVISSETEAYINMYKLDGSLVYSIKTSLEGYGYPADIAVSDDASKLAVSYVKTEGTNIKTELVFYDFSSSNTSEDKKIATFDNYDNKLIGDITFIDKNKLVAVAENKLTYYDTNGHISENKTIDIDSKIQKIVWGGSSFALIMQAEAESKDINRIAIYNANGGKVSDQGFGDDYTSYSLINDTVLMVGGRKFAIMDISGKFISKQTVENSIVALIPNGNKSQYFLITDPYVQRIKLK